VTRCPSELALEAYLLEPEKSLLAEHVHGCARCSERVARMEREGEHFRRFVLPATLDAVMAKNGPRRRMRWMWALLAPAALAAALLIGIRPAQPPDEYVGVKGGFGLAAYLAAPGGARPVRDGQAVQPAAALRFRVRGAGQCALWLVSIDESGQISRIYPTAGEGGATVSQADALPGGALLDGRPGLERFYAVCSPETLRYDDLVRSLRSVISGSAQVRAGPTLPGLPRGTRQASLLVEKRP
jgi:hypothetical protein